MTVSEVVAGSQTAVIGTEHTLAETGGTNDLPAGKTYVFEVDLNNLATNDVVELRLYIKVKTGGSIRQYDMVPFSNAQISPGVQSVPVPTAVYCKVTLKQTGGTARVFDWSVVSL